jgi:hypothetical protein
MIIELVTFKNLDAKYKTVLDQSFDDEQRIYLVKDNNMNVKTITTSIFQVIGKMSSVK